MKMMVLGYDACVSALEAIKDKSVHMDGQGALLHELDLRTLWGLLMIAAEHDIWEPIPDGLPHSSQPVFILKAQDALAPEIVREWAWRGISFGVSKAKRRAAAAIALQMEEWQEENATRKIPD